MGICVDFAIFAHFVFQKLNIKHAIAFTAFVDEVDDKASQLGHAYMIFREYGEYKIWNYFHGGIGDINGYFRNYQEAIDKCGPYFDVLYKSEVLMPGSIESHHPRACVSTYLEDGKDLEFIDKASEDKDDKNISQAELFMRSFKIQKLMIEANALKTKLTQRNPLNLLHLN